MKIKLIVDNTDLTNGPVIVNKVYEIEGEVTTHFMHRNDEGELIWNNKKYFEIVNV